jgi:hypothetical protein
MTDATEVIYRQTFMTDPGRRVLANMLCESGFFKHNKTSEEQAVENFVKTILCKCGCFDDNKSVDIINALLNTVSRKESK